MFTELTLRIRPKQFFRGEKMPESIPYESQVFRLMEKKDGKLVAGRTEGWNVLRRLLKECLGELEETTAATAASNTVIRPTLVTGTGNDG